MRFIGCGRFREINSRGAGLVYRGENGGAYINGLQRCKSVHACPVCSAAITKKRADQVAAGISTFLNEDADNRCVVMLTMTIRHKFNDQLGYGMRGLSETWSAMTSDKAYKGKNGIKARYKVAGVIWGQEVTHGLNGWHPHRHALMLLERPALSEDEATALKAELFEVWKRKALKNGLAAPSPKHGVDVQVADTPEQAAILARYTVKGMFDGLGAEVSGGGFKVAAEGHRTPFQILSDIRDAGPDIYAQAELAYEAIGRAEAELREMVAVYGEGSEQAFQAELALGDARELMPRDVALWDEWVEASNGWRQMYWSPGLRKRLRIEKVSDEVALAQAEAREAEQEAAAHAEALGLEVKPQPAQLIGQIVDSRSLARFTHNREMVNMVLAGMDRCSTAEQAQRVVEDILAHFGVEMERRAELLVNDEPVGMLGKQMDSPKYRPEVSDDARAVLSDADGGKRRGRLYPAPRIHGDAAQLMML